MRGRLTIGELFPDGMTIRHYAAERATRNAERQGRKKWNSDDRAVYLRVYYDILERVAGPDHPAVIDYKRESAA